MLLAVKIYVSCCGDPLIFTGVESDFPGSIRLTFSVLSFADMAQCVDVSPGMAGHGNRFGSSRSWCDFVNITVPKSCAEGVRYHRTGHRYSFPINDGETMNRPSLD